ncbi:hypothetical protein [Mucilaginibacter sp.]|uniref:hypothetical protein n=1 Tax=Mucilaginibacter sp. TaxID=1882438 RepID=UPI0025E4B4DA|nr:hypothetical protein [Mucilaginibacter sp.]
MITNHNPEINPKAFLRMITIIYGALLVGQTLFAIVVYSIAINPVLNLKPVNDIFFYLVPVFVIAMGFTGSLLYKKRIENARGAATVKEKIAGYQTAVITRLAPSEGATLFAIVIFMQGWNLYYLAIAALNIIYFLVLRPTRAKIEEDLNLSYDEKMEI